jgi:hypothetical protein
MKGQTRVKRVLSQDSPNGRGGHSRDKKMSRASLPSASRIPISLRRCDT